MRSYRDLDDQFRETPEERNERLRKSRERQMNRAPSPAAQMDALKAGSQPTDTPAPIPTDDEAFKYHLRMSAISAYDTYCSSGKTDLHECVDTMIARIRPLLEAHGIEMAADICTLARQHTMAELLRQQARQHVEGKPDVG